MSRSSGVNVVTMFTAPRGYCASVAFCVLHVALAVLLVVGPALPPEHVHEIEEEGHRALLVHHHFQVHNSLHHDADHAAVVDHDDAAVMTVAPMFTVPAARTAIAAPAVVRLVRVDPPAAPPTHRVAEYVDLLIHGPPRAPASLRAPPVAASL